MCAWQVYASTAKQLRHTHSRLQQLVSSTQQPVSHFTQGQWLVSHDVVTAPAPDDTQADAPDASSPGDSEDMTAAAAGATSSSGSASTVSVRFAPGSSSGLSTLSGMTASSRTFCVIPGHISFEYNPES